MSGFQIGVLVWLSLLTVLYLCLRHGVQKVIALLIEAKVLKIEKPEPARGPSNTLPYVPPDLTDPDNNPFLKAGIEALKKSKKEGGQGG